MGLLRFNQNELKINQAFSEALDQGLSVKQAAHVVFKALQECHKNEFNQYVHECRSIKGDSPNLSRLSSNVSKSFAVLTDIWEDAYNATDENPLDTQDIVIIDNEIPNDTQEDLPDYEQITCPIKKEERNFYNRAISIFAPSSSLSPRKHISNDLIPACPSTAPAEFVRTIQRVEWKDSCFDVLDTNADGNCALRAVFHELQSKDLLSGRSNVDSSLDELVTQYRRNIADYIRANGDEHNNLATNILNQTSGFSEAFKVLKTIATQAAGDNLTTSNILQHWASYVDDFCNQFKSSSSMYLGDYELTILLKVLQKEDININFNIYTETTGSWIGIGPSDASNTIWLHYNGSNHYSLMKPTSQD